MKNEKGFTLIELLAIIVILAIIAVITVPIILGIVDEAKKKAAEVSTRGYKEAVNRLYASKLMGDSDYYLEDKIYTVSELDTAGVSISGTAPESNSWVNIVNNELVSACLQFDDYKVTISDGVVGNAVKGECAMPFDPTPLIVTSGDGLYESTTEPGRLIYRGTNPDNYITLNEGTTSSPNYVTYRIVSFETDGTIKVVRDTSIGTKAYDEYDSSDPTTGPRRNSNNTYCNSSVQYYYGCNVWGNQNNTLHNGVSLGNIFNYTYYASASATDLINSQNSGTVTQDSTLNTYLNNTWIDNKQMAEYIDNHAFNVGGIYPIYNNIGIEKEKTEERQLQWTGKVALLNITEFIEASTNLSCTSVESNIGPRSGYPCKVSNWVIKNSDEWSLSPRTDSINGVWYVYSQGSTDYSTANNYYNVRPAFYLKSETSLIGSGTPEEPYSIP